MSEINKETQDHLNNLANVIDEKIEKASKASVDNAKNEVDSVIKGEVNNLVEKFNEGTEALNKRLDAIEVENKKKSVSNVFKTKKEAFTDAIGKSESLRAMKEGSRGNASMELKADVLISSDFSGASSSRDATGVSDRDWETDFF